MVMIAHTLTYGNVSSSEHGVYISGEGVYNAPERVVELVSVPGRNGALTIDQGHFDNITIEYPCFTFATSQEDFRRIVNNFKNAMAAQVGYQKLTDDYNPDEYRMALFVEGIEFEPVQYGRAGSFTLSFDCKPQRYLVDGDNEVTVSDGDVINNPTLYDAEPLLMVEGYGDIGFNGYNINIESGEMGSVYPMNASRAIGYGTTSLSGLTANIANAGSFNDGDTLNFRAELRVDISTVSTLYTTYSQQYELLYVDSTLPDLTADSGPVMSYDSQQVKSTSSEIIIWLAVENIQLTKGTPSVLTSVGTFQSRAFVITGSEESGCSYYVEVTVTFDYDGDSTVTISMTDNIYTNGSYGEYGPSSSSERPTINTDYMQVTFSDKLSYSTLSTLGRPIYIDTAIGEVYKYDNSNLVGLNAYVNLGSDLPRLVSGQNTFTIDNTITSLIVIPRWWQL